MKRRTQVVISVALVLSGIYLAADAFDLTPGVLTARPLVEEAAQFPTVSDDAVIHPTVPELDPSAAVPQDVKAAIEALAADSRVTGEVSVKVVDAMTGDVLGALNPDTARVPASNMKLLTAVAALSALGPDTTLPTTALLSGSTVYLVGRGDILLSAGTGDTDAVAGHAGLADLAKQAAAALKKAGATNVTVKVDSSAFSGGLYHSSIEGTDRDYVMEARPIAIDESRDDDGAFSADPDLSAGQVFSDALQAQGISVSFEGRATAPSGTTEVGRVESASMRQIVDYMLTNSDNSVATILGHLISIKSGYEGTFPGAVRGTLDVLNDLKLPTDGITIAENSGLSVDNRLTVAFLVELLQQVYQNEGGTLASIPSGLPVMGLNGTLQDRENGTNLSGRVRAKTGTLIEANSISGYLLTQQGRLLTFSVLIDHIDAGTTQVARDAEDDFLEALANE